MLARFAGGGLAAVLLIVTALGAPDALAHSRPIRFDPAPGAVLSAAPAQVQGWFTSDIRRDEDSFIRVLDATGATVSSSEIVLSADRRQMTATLRPGLGPGRYLVHWSTHDDADDEVFAGCYVFFVGQAAADAAVAEARPLDGGAACPANPPAIASNASLEISIADVDEGESATLEMKPTNFTVREPDGKTRDPRFGHYHIYLDKWPLELLTGEAADHSHDDEMEATPAAGGHMEDEAAEEKPPGGMKKNPMMVSTNSFTFTDLEPGVHTVTVVLTYDDHTLMQPPVLASASFRVRPKGGGVPLWGLAVGVAAGLAAGAAVAWAVGRRA